MICFNRQLYCYFINIVFFAGNHLHYFRVMLICVRNQFYYCLRKDLLISYIGRSYGGPYFRFYIKRICKFVSMCFFCLFLFVFFWFHYVF